MSTSTQQVGAQRDLANKRSPALSLHSKFFITTVLALSAGPVLNAAQGPWFSDPVKFAIFAAITLVASGLKIQLPGVGGTMSVSFVFLLISIYELTRLEALAIAAASAVLQYLWHSHNRFRAVQLLFNIALLLLAVSAASNVFHHEFLRSAGVSTTVVLALAACTYFVMNTLPVAVVIALTEHKNAATVWRDSYFWSLPNYLVGAIVAGLFHSLRGALGWDTATLLVPIGIAIHRANRLHRDHIDACIKHAQDMAGLHLRTVEALALAIEAKDQTTSDHLKRVQVYACEIGRELQLADEDMRALEAAALLHDIGKLAVPEHIISKPGKLTPEEFDKMKTHPTVGAEILERVKFPYAVAPIVAAHHEKWDGTGYPKGLHGEEIPLPARILAAVDCLDALASDRQYRPALPLDKAMQIISAEAGKAFDRRVVDVLKRRYIELEEMARAAGASLDLHLKLPEQTAPTAAPGAGFETVAPGSRPVAGGFDFIQSIAAARAEVQAVFELSQALGTSLSLSETLSVVDQRLQKVIAHEALAIFLVHEGQLTPEYVTGTDAELLSRSSVALGEGLAGWVAANRKPILNGNPLLDLPGSAAAMSLQSALAVPLEGLAGIIGVIVLYHSATDQFNRDHVRVLLAISSKLGLSIENGLRYKQVEDKAETDFLTGLPNGRSFFRRLEEDLSGWDEADVPVYLVVSDLDRFKRVNDEFGHVEGNRTLQAVGKALRTVCGPETYLARLGGDEFVLILRATNEGELRTLAHRMRAEIELMPIARPTGLSMSVGWARFGADGCRAEELLATADHRMYAAKRTRGPESSADVTPPLAAAACR